MNILLAKLPIDRIAFTDLILGSVVAVGWAVPCVMFLPLSLWMSVFISLVILYATIETAFVVFPRGATATINRISKWTALLAFLGTLIASYLGWFGFEALDGTNTLRVVLLVLSLAAGGSLCIEYVIRKRHCKGQAR